MSPIHPRIPTTPGRPLHVEPSTISDISVHEWGLGAGARPVTDDDLRNLRLGSCVKIFTTHVAPNYAMPWQRGEESKSTGSGFAVRLPDTGEKRILTNAHCVEHSLLVQVRRVGQAQKFVANVLSLGFDCDVAILDVQDEEFWDGLQLTEVGTGLPRLTSEVVAVGYPIGGEDVSTTRGVVSRILVGGLTDNLCVQIDAAINPGNSGGPVFDEGGRLVGIAFSGITGASSIGYIIPLPTLRVYLSAVAKGGVYRGRCTDCFEVQPMESSMLRKKFGMANRQTGVLITKVPAESPSRELLKQYDVLLSIDGTPIANDGTVQLPDCKDTVRVTFSYLVYRVIEVRAMRTSTSLLSCAPSPRMAPRACPVVGIPTQVCRAAGRQNHAGDVHGRARSALAAAAAAPSHPPQVCPLRGPGLRPFDEPLQGTY